ncbi:hypothetical protein CYMTET_30933, partial [Cymbomonas tetramitiformis]
RRMGFFRHAQKTPRKNEKATATALFKLMRLNPVCLKLSIPLDYLELRAKEDRRGDGPSHLAPADVPAHLADISPPEEQVASPRVSATRLQRLLAKKSGGSAWKTLQKKIMLLPVERMLGTALVHAFLGIRSIIAQEDLALQAHMASSAPWQMPLDRSFNWYVNVFKVLLNSIDREGWYQKSRLFNVIFLQRGDGSFEMSQFLATMLKAGRPVEDLVLNPLAEHDVHELEISIPIELQQMFDEVEWAAQVRDGVRATAEGGELEKVHPGEPALRNRLEMREMWATILVMQWLENLPFSWTENPADPPSQQVTIRQRSALFIQSLCVKYPQLEALLPNLTEAASTKLEAWQVRHREKIIEVYNTVGPLAHLRKEPPFLELPWTQKKRKLHRLARRLSSATKRNIKWGLKAHPLTAIGLVGATEPFSRSERVLIQANTFVMMLLFTVWFYYSKAVNCCQDFRAVISCPRERDVEEPCFGFPSGVALREGADEGLLPEEVQAMDFTCNAFPQSTFTGKVWVIVIIVGILTPMTMILSQLFIMASNATIPANWGTYRTKKSEKLFGRTLTAVVQTIFLMCYAVFFNFQKFNKAMAVTLVSLLGILINARYVRAVIQAFVEAYKRLLHWSSVDSSAFAAR